MKKGISPIVSYVLVLSIVLTSTIIAFAWALPLSEQLGEEGKVTNYKNQMIGLDYSIRSAAHGDINFVNEYEMHLQEATIFLDSEKNTVYLLFQQRATVLGDPEVTGTLTCDSETEYLRHDLTRIDMYRESNLSRVYQGSAGGPGQAVIAICYSDINLTWEGDCSEGRGGPRTLVRIKKTGATDKPVVSIDLC